MKFLLLVFLIAIFNIKVFCSDIAFINVGSLEISENGIEIYKKTFFIPRYFKSSWINAGTLCQSHGLEFASLHTLEEFNAIVPMLTNNSRHLTTWTHINGMTLTPRSATDWYWVNSQQKIDYTIPWCPNQPDHSMQNEWCLSLAPAINASYCFNAIDCDINQVSFLCQKLEINVS